MFYTRYTDTRHQKDVLKLAGLTLRLFLGTTIATGVNTLERPLSEPLFKMLLELGSHFLQQSIDIELMSALH